jgi:hypothetical protein
VYTLTMSKDASLNLLLYGMSAMSFMSCGVFLTLKAYGKGCVTVVVLLTFGRVCRQVRFFSSVSGVWVPQLCGFL